MAGYLSHVPEISETQLPGDLDLDLCRLSLDLLRCRLGLLLRCLSRRGEGLKKHGILLVLNLIYLLTNTYLPYLTVQGS